MIRTRLIAAALFLLTRPVEASPAPLPAIRDGQLMVDGRPFLMLGGELANSSSSSREYMAERWPKLTAIGLNTVVMPVSWQQLEPTEGRFDYRLIDGLLADARAAHLRVVLLWFGSYKNSLSEYAPGWVKRDTNRFPRARLRDGRAIEMLDPFAPANVAADARAFAALMAHLAETDPQHSVVMVQVENEMGMIPEARDWSVAARAAWASPVPAGAPGAGKTWEGAFGTRAEEAFMAWAFGRYTEAVAAAGKRALSLPLYINVALPRPGAVAGSGYPSGGPTPDVAAVWKAAAPSIDLLAPDIYFPDFSDWADRYAQINHPLFVPEAEHAGDPGAAANAFYVFGQLGAIGFSPFAIDEIAGGDRPALAEAYAALAEVAPLLLDRHAGHASAGFRARVSPAGAIDLADQRVELASVGVTAHFVDPWTPRDRQQPSTHGALAIALGPDELLLVGRGVTFTFAPSGGAGSIGIERVEEGHYRDGTWIPRRLLSGDETHQGRHVRLPPDHVGIQRVWLYHYR
jgi:beta-galactosidase GanA